MAIPWTRFRRIHPQVGAHAARTFSVVGKCGYHAVRRLEVVCASNRIFVVVHVSKVHLVKVFLERIMGRLNVEEAYRVDFD